jgi:hypothetical protein
MLILRILVLSAVFLKTGIPPAGADESEPAPAGWKKYTNSEFGFSVEYPPDWRLGQSLADGMGITLHPPIPNSQFALSGFLNTIEGTSQNGRQTTQEFAAAHRRLVQDVFAKENIQVKWEQEHLITLGGRPAVQLTFSYRDDSQATMIEFHIFSVGRTEGRGVRIKLSDADRAALMPSIAQMLQTYEPGRDQDAAVY